MKVILLDNDGVICLHDQWGSRYKKRREFYFENPEFEKSTEKDPVNIVFDDFDEESIVILNEILTITDAEIVVSSDWKNYATLEELGDYYIQQGVLKRPIAVTRDFEEIIKDRPEAKKEFGGYYIYRDHYRYWETKDYILNNPDLESFVIIDDIPIELIEPVTNFVKTNEIIGIKEKGLKEKIIKILNDGKNFN